jgi:hypothetical protein
MKRTCDRLWEVDAMREGRLFGADAASHERHLQTCAECAERHREDDRLARLGRALPTGEQSPLDVRRMRARILKYAAIAPADGVRRRGTTILALAAAMALVIGVVLAALPRTHAPEAVSFASTVIPAEGAVWSRTRAGQTERVALQGGIIIVEVRKQSPGERFLVALPDGEIEVRGTRFEVEVADGRTRSVRVLEGVVALRLVADEERVLRAPASWSLPPAPVVTPPVVVVTPSSLPDVRETRSAPATPPPTAAAAPPTASSQTSAEYEAAMAEYRAHRYAEAARLFGAFATAHPNAPEAEDAAFLESNALAHDGRADAAAHLAERFLAAHPKSFHARDAAILIARAARDRNDCERARAALASWSGPEVEAALGRCAP